MKHFLLLLLTVYLAPTTVVVADEIACGEQISQDVKLETNLDCRSTGLGGLSIGANDVTINLNGYSIAGDDPTQAGISGEGLSSITIKNGAIYGFGSGVLLRDSNDIAIEQLTIAHQANESIFIGESSDVRIQDVQISLVYENPGIETIGILLFGVEDARLENVNTEGSFYGVQSLESKRVKVIDSSFTDIWHVGIRLVKNRDSSLENNRVTGIGLGPFECYSAIDVVGQASNHIQIKSNTVAECGFGIFVVNDPADPANRKFSIRDNHVRLTGEGILLNGLQDSDVVGNRVHFNLNGISLWDFARDNRIAGNKATGNVTWDLFHDETSVDNHWTENTCVFSNAGDIDCP